MKTSERLLRVAAMFGLMCAGLAGYIALARLLWGVWGVHAHLIPWLLAVTVSWFLFAVFLVFVAARIVNGPRGADGARKGAKR